jgi:hypothetical protein
MAAQFIGYVVSSVDNMDSMVVYWYFNPLDGGCFSSFFLLLCNEPFWLAHNHQNKTKKKTLEALKIEVSIGG